MTIFRPCIDLHQGQVKQIVGGTLTESGESLKTNHVSPHPPEYFARKYREDELFGGHVIMLGPSNEGAARAALSAYPGGLQIGGGIHPDNAIDYLNAGASHVIVTSYLFDQEGQFQTGLLEKLAKKVGVGRLIIDLSCRREGDSWIVAMNRWQTPTNITLSHETLDALANACTEFLIHAADVEGKCEGIDEDLVQFLGNWGKIPITYAGGGRSLDDLHRVQELSNGNVDLTIGSALDLFGGDQVRYEDCVAFNQRKV